MSTVNDIPEQYLYCRDIAHAWTPFSAEVRSNPRTRKREIRRILRCARCRLLKHQRLSLVGDLIGSTYRYDVVDGYLLKNGRLPASERSKLRRRNTESWLKGIDAE